MRQLYTLTIHLYHFAIHIASLFDSKARLWVNGRKTIFNELTEKVVALKELSGGSRLVWFHCASLGEFEQGRPLIERYRAERPEDKILLSFFSPSGYEIRKSYAGADIICYLPIDTPANSRKFLEIVSPDAAFFVKYEFWFNYLRELKAREIPTYLVSGIFREDHYFFKPAGGWFRKQLTAFTHFFLQDQASLERLNKIGYVNATLAGDTRFDRVAELAATVKHFDLVKLFAEGYKVIVLGSSWSEDEKLFADIDFEKYKLIIAPHEIDAFRIGTIRELFEGNSLLYSKANTSNIFVAKVLIIDNIGMLSSLYQYGQIAFIGGGFGKGIHNVLEAAAFGRPVIFGPNHQKFEEAKDLLKMGGGFTVKDVPELNQVLTLLEDEQVLHSASQISKMYVRGKTGATEKILRRLGF